MAKKLQLPDASTVTNQVRPFFSSNGKLSIAYSDGNQWFTIPEEQWEAAIALSNTSPTATIDPTLIDHDQLLNYTTDHHVEDFNETIIQLYALNNFG